MGSSSQISTKFFPFSPGIPWELKKGRYVIPKLPVSCFHDILENRDAVVSGFGGLAESFFSLTILETINHMIPGTKMFWCGPGQYKYLYDINGLAKPFGDITEADLSRFPVPIFFDKNNRSYFNYLNNYINVKPYWQIEGYRDYRPIIEQILEKSTMKWDERHMPQWRNFKPSDDLAMNMKIHKIHMNRKFALLFPDGDEFSIHNKEFLSWDVQEIRSAAAILQQSNIPLIILTSNIQKYAYSQAKVLPLRLDFAYELIRKASFVLANKIDFHLVAGAISSATIISREFKREYSIAKNLAVIESDNDIYLQEKLNVSEVCSFIAESEII